MNKAEFTKSIIEEAELDIEFDQAIRTWWFTTCDTHYRLTHRGYKTLSTLTSNFEFRLSYRANGRVVLQLGKLNCAYFVYTNSKGEEVVHIFSTKIATIIQLYGSIDKYLDTL